MRPFSKLTSISYRYHNTHTNLYFVSNAHTTNFVKMACLSLCGPIAFVHTARAVYGRVTTTCDQKPFFFTKNCMSRHGVLDQSAHSVVLHETTWRPWQPREQRELFPPSHNSLITQLCAQHHQCAPLVRSLYKSMVSTEYNVLAHIGLGCLWVKPK